MTHDPRSITEENFPAFRGAYRKALEEQKQVFIFEGNEVYTPFAKYVVEYFEYLKRSDKQ